MTVTVTVTSMTVTVTVTVTSMTVTVTVTVLQPGDLAATTVIATALAHPLDDTAVPSNSVPSHRSFSSTSSFCEIHSKPLLLF
jgi:hypothetical protein